MTQDWGVDRAACVKSGREAVAPSIDFPRLHYRNRRGDYLAQWWTVVNRDAVNARHAATLR